MGVYPILLFSLPLSGRSPDMTEILLTGTLSLNSIKTIIEPVHEIFNNVVCVTSKASDQPAHTRSLIRAFASHLSIL